MYQESLARIHKLLDMMDGKGSAFNPNKISFSKVELTKELQDLELAMTNDYSQCIQIASDRERILNDAKNNAKETIEKAQLQAQALVDENAITVAANRKADSIITEANMQKAQILQKAESEAKAMIEQAEARSTAAKDQAKAYIAQRMQLADKHLEKTLAQLIAGTNGLQVSLDEIRNFYQNLVSIDLHEIPNNNG